MAEAKSDTLPFAADALHTNALAASNDAAWKMGGADYYGLQQAILEVGRPLMTPGARLIDLRCDLGLVMPLVQESEDLCRFTLLSPEGGDGWKCFDAMRTRVRLGFVDAAVLDLGEGFPELSARMMLAVGALSPLSAPRRTEVVEGIHRRLERKGAAIVVEEVEADGDSVPVHKEAGGINKPKRRRWSPTEWESLLSSAGFRTVDRIWTDGGRMAWVVMK